MGSFKQACAEIVKEIGKTDIKTQRELNRIKLMVLGKYKANGLMQIPKNADIYFAASEDERDKLVEVGYFLLCLIICI